MTSLRRVGFLLVVVFWSQFLGGPVAARADDTGEAVIADIRGHRLARQERYQEAMAALCLSHRLLPNARRALAIARLAERIAQERKHERAEPTDVVASVGFWHAQAFNWSETALASPDVGTEMGAEVRALMARVRPKVAVLGVATDPPGAEIYLESETLGLRGRAPRAFAVALPAKVSALTFKVIARIGGQRAEATVMARLGKNVPVALRFGGAGESAGERPLPGAILSVTGQPTEAEVTLDGVSLGTTPLSRAALAPGKGRLQIAASGFQAFSSSLPLEAGGATRVQYHLAPAGHPGGHVWSRLAYVSGGLLLSGGLVVGGLAGRERAAFLASPTREGKRTVERLNLAADTLMLSGLLTLGVTAAIQWLTPSPPASAAQVTFDR